MVIRWLFLFFTVQLPLFYLFCIYCLCLPLRSVAADTARINGCFKPFILATHPLGQFIGRISHNFNTAPAQRNTISLGMSSANVWQPEVKGYFPHDENVTHILSAVRWDQRDSVFQGYPGNYDSTVFSSDGVLRTFHVSLRIKLTSCSELDITGRALLLSGGAPPTALLTSDGFIEWFHSHIKGGEDPFARRQYPMNQAGIFYQDEQGRKIQLHKGGFMVPGIQLNYYHYANVPWLNRHQLQASVGAHLSLNLASFNRCADAGVSGTLQKQFNRGRRHIYTLGASGSILRQRIVTSGRGVDFSHNQLLKSAECMFEFRKKLDKQAYWALGLNFYYLDPYHPANEFDRVTPVGKRISSHWHLALTHMYRNSQYWSLVYSYGRSVIWSIYALQDFKVNNGPDFQTGFSVVIPYTK